MAAETDFPYLQRLARTAEDKRRLELITRMRRRILRGEPAESPEHPGPAEERFFELHVGGETLVMREDLAPASVDTYLEIFRDRAHQLHPAFSAAGTRRIVDLGANEGYYTLKMKRENPEAEVLAVEPYPPAFELLRRNIAANGLTGVTAVSAAVCGPGRTESGNDEPGMLTLESYPHVSSVTSADLTAFPRPWIRREQIRRRQVPAATLPELLRTRLPQWMEQEIDLLKIDIEGMELEALAGAEELLPRVAAAVVEAHGSGLRRRCIDYLTARGFRCVREEEKRSGDAYFLRRRADSIASARQNV